MKLSHRETVLIFLLGIILIIFVGLNFLIKPAIADNKTKQSEYDKLYQTLVKSNADIALLNTIDDQISKQYEAALTAAEPFSQSIEQTAIDRYINGLEKENRLSQTSINISEMEISNADYYSEIKSTTKSNDTIIPIEQSAQIINGTATNNAAAESSDSSGTNLMYCTTVNLAVVGYDLHNIFYFLDDLYTDGRALIIEKLNITVDEKSSEIKATMTIKFFGAPEIYLN
jgi:hypothetical protein